MHRATLRIHQEDEGAQQGKEGAHQYNDGSDKGGGYREVEAVLKVQHPNVAQQLMIDISASVCLALLLGAIAPNVFRDLRPIIREIAEITRAELDFRQEASNQELARETLKVGIMHVYMCVHMDSSWGERP